jgi:hypothetical protein
MYWCSFKISAMMIRKGVGRKARTSIFHAGVMMFWGETKKGCGYNEQSKAESIEFVTFPVPAVHFSANAFVFGEEIGKLDSRGF